jgi:hypothetical protein
MIKRNKLLLAIFALALTLTGLLADTPAGTGTKDDPVLMVVTGEFTKPKMAEVLGEIDSAKKYMILDLTPMTDDIFDLEYLERNGKDYIVSLKIPGVTKNIAGTGGGYYILDRFPSLASVTFEGAIPSSGFSVSSPFLGDLRSKFYAENPTSGTPGIYKTTAPVGNSSMWIKQP